jgi:hypothetical protein
MCRVFPPSEPPDGEHSQSFRLIVGGTQLRGSWYLLAIVRLQGFSSGSPAASPRRWSPKTVTTSSMVGRSEPGCDLGPALSFKDLHHPGWGGDRAEPELYLPRGFMGHLLPSHSRERALTGLAGGSDFDNAGLVGGERRPSAFCCSAGPPIVGGCSYPRRRNQSSVCNGTLSAGVCSLWLSGPEHVCIFGTEPCFFLISSTGTRLSAN